MPPERFPIPQGTLDMLVLQILSLGPAHGYAIAQRIEQISRNAVQVNQGSLYPALHRLEQKKWLRSEWRGPPHRRRGTVSPPPPPGGEEAAPPQKSRDAPGRRARP